MSFSKYRLLTLMGPSNHFSSGTEVDNILEIDGGSVPECKYRYIL